MEKVLTLIIGTLFSLTIFAQQRNENAIRVGPAPIEIDETTFYLRTSTEDIKLDSAKLQTIKPNWIKSIKIERLEKDSKQDHAMSNFNSTVTVYIVLKKRYLKKYLDLRVEKIDDI